MNVIQTKTGLGRLSELNFWFPLLVLHTLSSLLLCCSNYTLGWLGFWGGVLTDLYSVLKQGAEGAPFLYSSVNSLECRLLCPIFPPALLSFRPSQVGLGVTGTPWGIYIGFPFPHRIRIAKERMLCEQLFRLLEWKKKVVCNVLCYTVSVTTAVSLSVSQCVYMYTWEHIKLNKTMSMANLTHTLLQF